jgi:hypothetical protein
VTEQPLDAFGSAPHAAARPLWRRGPGARSRLPPRAAARFDPVGACPLPSRIRARGSRKRCHIFKGPNRSSAAIPGTDRIHDATGLPHGREPRPVPTVPRPGFGGKWSPVRNSCFREQEGLTQDGVAYKCHVRTGARLMCRYQPVPAGAVPTPGLRLAPQCGTSLACNQNRPTAWIKGYR